MVMIAPAFALSRSHPKRGKTGEEEKRQSGQMLPSPLPFPSCSKSLTPITFPPFPLGQSPTSSLMTQWTEQRLSPEFFCWKYCLQDRNIVGLYFLRSEGKGHVIYIFFPSRGREDNLLFQPSTVKPTSAHPFLRSSFPKKLSRKWTGEEGKSLLSAKDLKCVTTRQKLNRTEEKYLREFTIYYYRVI